jgi:hypothetical protein
MTLRTIACGLLVVGLAGVAGCTPRNARTDDDRFRGMIPTSRPKDKSKPIAAKPIDRPTDTPPLLAPPMPDDLPTPSVPVDFAKAPTELQPAAAADPVPPRIIERIRGRRDERRNPGEEAKPDETPKLPSPFAKEKESKPPVAGGDFPTPGDKKPAPTTPADPVAPRPLAGTTAKPAGKLDEVKRVYGLCKQKWDGLKDYEARLVRREVIAGKEAPTEEMIFRFRKEPYSVHTKNIGGAGKGREVLYVAGPGAKMHIVTGEGDNRLVGAGFYTQVSPDDRMVTAKSRHKITEGAVGRTVEMLGKAIAKAEAGQFDGLKSMGKVQRKEYADPVEGIEAILPPGQDPELPKGGRREVYFDANPQSPSYGLPLLIRLLDGDRELEYYAFSQYKVPANFTDADFDPARMGKRR